MIDPRLLDGLDAVGEAGLVLVLICAGVCAFFWILGNFNLAALFHKRHETDDEILAEINRTTPRISDDQIKRIIEEEKRREQEWQTKKSR